MRIIISRKGFDKAAGSCASPILRDGALMPLPIPDGRRRKMNELSVGGVNVGAVVADLTRGRQQASRRHDGNTAVHLDPDLDPRILCCRPPDWRPAFGQIGKWQKHLARHGVRCGDLFLFFG